jgi:hypothetical protein
MREEALSWLLSYLQKKSLKTAAYVGPGVKKMERIYSLSGEGLSSNSLNGFSAVVGYRVEIPDYSDELFRKCAQYLELCIGGDQVNPYESVLFSRDASARSDFHGVHAAFRKRLLRGAWLVGDGRREYYRSLLYSEVIREFVDSGGAVRQFQGRGSVLMMGTAPQEPRGRVIEDLRDGVWVRRL